MISSKSAEYHRIYNSRPENLARHNLRNKQTYSRLRGELMNILGNKCVRCGFSDNRALQLDHINGKGRREIMVLGSYRMIRKYSKDIVLAKENLQILCANCNWIKRNENGENGYYAIN